MFVSTTTNPIYARNLTPDGTNGMKLTQAQFIESMRTGKDFVDKWPVQAVHRWMTNYDLQAIAGIPAVANPVMPDM